MIDIDIGGMAAEWVSPEKHKLRQVHTNKSLLSLYVQTLMLVDLLAVTCVLNC